MDQLAALRAFVAVADLRGFARAARRLSLSPSGVTRAVASLEERLGTRLLHRSTRVVRVTEAGARFLADTKRILAELEEAEASAAGSHREPRGQLAITAPVMFGRMFVAPLVLEFTKRHPEVNARLLLVDRIVDLTEEGLDIAVRLAKLPDSALSAVRVGTVRRVVCASLKYLAERGRPEKPSDLATHDAVSFSTDAPQASKWSFSSGSRSVSVNPRIRLAVNSAEVAVAAAVAGHGVTRVLSYQVAKELRNRKLEIVLAEHEPPPIPIQVVHREGRHASARVRACVDFLVKRLRNDEALDPS